MSPASENVVQTDKLLLTPEEEGQIKTGGRWLRRVVNPFVDFHVIVTVGIATASSVANQTSERQDGPDVQGYLKDLTSIQREIYAEDFKQIIKHMPFVKGRLESNSEPSRTIQKVLNNVQTAADKGKHDDTGGVKHDIIKLIPQRCLPSTGGSRKMTVQSYVEDIRAPDLSKTWRGFENILTAALLCPVDHLAAMKADPDDTRMQLQSRALTLIDSEGDPKFPLFLYDPDLVDRSITQGLFRGPFLLAVYLRIFVSPSAAVGGKISSKRGNAKIHGMTEVTPPTICYAAIQAYVTLCSIEKWGQKWEDVNLERLYILLREQLMQPDDPFVVETLKWWNKQVFGDTPGTDEGYPDTRDTQGPSMRERLENERRERMRVAASTPGN